MVCVIYICSVDEVRASRVGIHSIMYARVVDDRQFVLSSFTYHEELIYAL